MPLINFRTDLKSLRYGADRPGGGSSGQPFVQSPIPDEPTTLPASSIGLFERFYSANRNESDFPIRGGVVEATGPAGRPVTVAGQIDAARIKAFLDDPKKGKMFLFKQQGLQLSNPNTQVPGVAQVLGFDPLNPDLINTIIPATRLYSPTGDSTLAQVLVQGTGQHIQRHGLLPVYLAPFQQKYEYIVSNTNTATANRLSVLHQTKVAVNNPFLVSKGKDPNAAGEIERQRQTTVALLNNSVKYGISPLGNQIYNYIGGPGSVYGVGFTIINRATDTTQAAQKAATLNNAFTFTYQQLLNQQTAGSGSVSARQKVGAKIQDFRAQLNTATAAPGNFLTADYNDTTKWYSKSDRTGPGAPELKKRVSYTEINNAKVDRVNSIGLIKYDATKYDGVWNTPYSSDVKDIIKFGFECLDNDNPGNAIALVFRAFLTSFTDNHQAEYNSFKYLGRGETFRTYQGFDRSINFGFKIAAQSREEMRGLYIKLNHLISQAYPDYSKTSKLMRGSVVMVTIGDYLYRVPGFIESINITALNDAAWEIALDPTGLDKDINQVPQMVEVQCSFKPIHNFLPRRETSSDDFVPLIGSYRVSESEDPETGIATPTKEGWLAGPGQIDLT